MSSDLEDESEVSTLSVDMDNYNHIPRLSVEEYLEEWDDDPAFQLWKDPKFRNYAQDVVKAFKKFSYDCIWTCARARYRAPTIHEFWNFYISKLIPRQSWYALWKEPNSDRRGWPLQYSTKAKVLVDAVTFSSSLSLPTVSPVVVESMVDAYPVGRKLKDVAIWQLEPVEPGPDFYEDGISVDKGKAALLIMRKFYEVLYFPADSEDLLTYVENTLFHRLTLNYYLENQAPSNGILSSKDRGRIISAIKHYHFLKNKIQELYLEAVDEDLDEDEGEAVESQQERSAQTLAFEVQLENHKSALDHAINPQMRLLIDTINEETACDNLNVGNSDYFLVMKDLTLEELKCVYDTLADMDSHDKSANIRIINDLEAALKQCNHGSTVYVVSGNYNISGLGRMEQGGNVIGIQLNDKEVTITPSDETGDVWMLVNSRGIPTSLKNLTFALDEDIDGFVSSVIFVSSGELNMEECVFRRNQGKMSSVLEECVSVTAVGKADQAKLKVTNCDFINFDDIDYPGATVDDETLTNYVIESPPSSVEVKKEPEEST